MNQPLRSSSAISLVFLSSMIAGCAVPLAHMKTASQVDSKANGEVGLATRALVALNSRNVPMAIDYSERAVARTPGDASLRALLGNAYFAGGRFHSAETAFRDSLTIDAGQPQVVLKLALVEIALGKNQQAAGLLNANRAMLDPSDFGLALALAGKTSEAVAVLDPAARQPGADSTVRQNLALAHALAGEWEEARTIAAQDVPAAQLDARIQQWMQLARPTHAADQVAALVGVVPAAVDAGQPVQLALNRGDTQQAQAVAPAVAPVPAGEAPAVAAAAPPAVVALAAPPPSPAPVMAVPPAPPPARPTLAALASTAVSEAKAVLASVLPHNLAPLARPAKASPPHRAPLGKSTAVVQLGAYGSPERVLTAWDRVAHKYGALKAYLPMSARFASPKGTFYRLSVQGFDSIAQANALCGELKREGGSCFVRNVAGDVPVQYASR